MSRGDWFGDEMAKRRELAPVFSLRPEDFPSLREFKDYEELTETIIYDVVYGSEPKKVSARERLSLYLHQHEALINMRQKGPESKKLTVNLENITLPLPKGSTEVYRQNAENNGERLRGDPRVNTSEGRKAAGGDVLREAEERRLRAFFL